MISSRIIIASVLSLTLLDAISNHVLAQSSIIHESVRRIAQDRRKEEADLELQKTRSFLLKGKAQQGLIHAKRALKLYRDLNHALGQQETLGRMGWLYVQQQEFDLALETTQQSLKIKASENENYEALGLQGYIYLLQNQPKKVLSAYNAQLQNADSRQNKYMRIQALENLALAYTAFEAYPKALNVLEEIIAYYQQRAEPVEPSLFSKLGYVQFKMGNLNESEQTLLQALEVGEAAGSNIDLGVAQLIGNAPDQAVKQMEAIYGKDHPKLAEIREQLKQTYDSLKILEQLKGGDQEQLDLLRVLKSSEPHQANTCSTLQRIYASQDNHVGLEISERCRARAFARRLTSKLTSDALGQTSSLDLSQIRDVARSNQSTIVQYSILSEDDLTAGQYQQNEDTLMIWVIQPNGNITSREVDLQPIWNDEIQSLEELVNQTRISLGIEGRASVVPRRIQGERPSVNEDALKDLHQLLIQPITDLLPQDSNERVVFIPQGGLLSVPFAALMDQSGTFLLEQHTIASAPSIHSMALTHQRLQQVKRQKNRKVLVIGNPKMPKYSPSPDTPAEVLPALPGAEIEAKAIADLYRTQPILGTQASEMAVTPQLSDAKIIHFATHGLLDSPPQSTVGAWVQLSEGDVTAPNYNGRLKTPGAIALAAGEGQDGLLTSDEIVKLDLNAELVVLSACDTAQGTVVTDGMVGLSRAILAAGAPSVLASLWKVSDTATADLMVEFYQQLQSNPDRARALRQAMLKVRQQYPNPSDWAAFSLIGAT